MTNRNLVLLSIILALALTLTLTAPALALDCQPSQTEFNFQPLKQGMTAYGTMWIHNNSDEPLRLEFDLEDTPHFSLGNSWNTTVQPGATYTLSPNFHPQSGGEHEAWVSLGNEMCEDILLRGTGLGITCDMDPAFVDFGNVPLGSSASRTVQLTNTGDVSMDITGTSLEPGLAILGPSGSMPPGATWTFTLLFTPELPGLYTGVVSWTFGYPSYDYLRFAANAEVDMAPGENRVGLFFDDQYTSTMAYTDGSAEFMTGYLVLTNPAPYEAVAGWELAPMVTGSASLYNWDIQGDFINAGSGNNLIIGLGGAPLPPSDAVLLATCQIYVAESAGETISVNLVPAVNSTYPGVMAWQPAVGDPQVMLPFTGMETVAWIKTGQLSAAPDPAAPGRARGGSAGQRAQSLQSQHRGAFHPGPGWPHPGEHLRPDGAPGGHPGGRDPARRKSRPHLERA